MTRAVIRLRSSIKSNQDVKDTLRYLRLNKVNHCVLVPEGKTYDGMLHTVKDYVTWGEVKSDVLTNLLIKRGRLSGNRPITNQYIKENTKHESMVKYAEALSSGKEELRNLKDATPVFRLHPPQKGHEGIKHTFKEGGALGYRGEAINDLIVKMLGPQKAAEAKPTAKPKATAEKPKKAPAKKPAKKKEVGE